MSRARAKTGPQLVTVDTADMLNVGGVAWAASSSAEAINAAAANIAASGPDWARWPGAPEGASRGEKAFIYGVWKLVFHDQISLDAFKDLIRELQRRNMLQLSRFDLVGARGTRDGYEITTRSTTPIRKDRPDDVAHWTFIVPKERLPLPKEAPFAAQPQARKVPKKRPAAMKRGATSRRIVPQPAQTSAPDLAMVEAALLKVAAQHRPGTLLLVRDVRAASGLAKKRFDAAVMALSRDGRAVVHHHDHPMALTTAERNALVWSPQGSSDTYAGTYYIGIAPRSAQPINVEDQIRTAYLRLSGGKLNRRVRLAPLRAELSGVAREAVDAELIALQQRGEAVLYPLDDPQQIRREDTEAALRVSGERRDLLYLTAPQRR